MAVGQGGATGRYVGANGLRIYFEERGEGTPLVLIHGGINTSNAFRNHIPLFARRYRVIAPDSRGHGRTDNPAGTLSYRMMADDVAALCEALGLDRPLILGYSDGGMTTMQVGIHHPDLPRALAIGGCSLPGPGYLDGLREWAGPGRTEGIDPDHVARLHPDWYEFWREQTREVHGPDYWASYLRQAYAMWADRPAAPEELGRIRAPTLVLAGDRDTSHPVEQVMWVHQLIAGSELAIVPGAGHADARARFETLCHIALDFFARRAGEEDGAGGGRPTGA